MPGAKSNGSSTKTSKSASSRSKSVIEHTESQDNDASSSDSAPQTTTLSMPKARPSKVPSVDVLMRNINTARSKISVIIDSLEGDDNDTSLKRNVSTAVKHLKEIYTLLE